MLALLLKTTVSPSLSVLSQEEYETKIGELQLFKTVGLVIQKIQKDVEKVWGLIGSVN